MTLKPERPYLDFYAKHNISPVDQDISNLKKHFERREFLYRRLGIASSSINEKSVIEFGPGSGHNSLFTYSLSPSKYILVDGNPKGLNDCSKLLSQYFPEEKKYSLIESLIEEFKCDEKFDLVLCEGLIPAQKNSIKFSQHIADFTKPKGICVLTCHDSISYFSELLRCLIGSIFIEEEMSMKKKVEILLKIFESHLTQLKGMSRSHEDWLIDNIINNSLWRDSNLFSIEEAIKALDNSFDIYGVSPYFFTDWRWYKDVYGEEKKFNEVALKSYQENMHNFLDYRYLSTQVSITENHNILKKSIEVRELIATFGKNKDSTLIPIVCKKVSDIEAIVRLFFKDTADAMGDFVSVLGRYPNISPETDWGRFSKWWGRGMQYLSFIRCGDISE